MLSKLLSLLVAGKGGAVAAAAIVASATTVSVITTSTDVQTTVQDVVAAVSGVVSPGLSERARSGDRDNDGDKDNDDHRDRCERGKPLVVAERNAADKALRQAFEEQHRRLEHDRGGKDVDHEKANAILEKADRELRGVLTKALNDVAAQTLGREGLVKESASPKPSPSATPTATATPTPTPTPTPTATATATGTATATASASAKPSCSPKPSASPNAVTLTAALQGIVDKAKADMKAVVDKALADVAALPTPSHRGGDGDNDRDDHGRSGDHAQPATTERGEHKPSASPGHR